MKKNNLISFTISLAIMGLIATGVYQNLLQERATDKSKIPEKVELNKGFQRWITNLKNKDFDIEADEFRLQEENEIYNTQYTKVSSIEESGKREEFEQTINSMKDIKKVVFSPSERGFIDFRNEVRGVYLPNEVHYYGLRDDKVIDARVVGCSVNANCYFDRAYFINNDVFVVSEISRNIPERETNPSPCSLTDVCDYTFKVHVIDLINNSRAVYESKPYAVVLNDTIPEL